MLHPLSLAETKLTWSDSTRNNPYLFNDLRVCTINEYYFKLFYSGHQENWPCIILPTFPHLYIYSCIIEKYDFLVIANSFLPSWWPLPLLSDFVYFCFVQWNQYRNKCWNIPCVLLVFTICTLWNTLTHWPLRDVEVILQAFCLRLVPQNFNSLWPSDSIWWQRPGSTLAQVMACCLTAPSHYLNQCWLIISKV